MPMVNGIEYKKVTVYGWGMVPIKDGPYKGEFTPCCPKCHDTFIRIATRYPAHGTGSRGQGRLGDPGSVTVITCMTCNEEKVY